MAPDNLINLKKTRPPIAVFSIPKITENNIPWFAKYIFNGLSKIKARGIKIKKAKYVDPVNIYNGSKFGIFLI